MRIQNWTKSVMQYTTWAIVDTVSGVHYVDCNDLHTFSLDDLRDLDAKHNMLSNEEHDAHPAVVGLWHDFGISGIYSVEVRENDPAYFGYLSMPGYLDITEMVGPCQTIEEVNAELDALIEQEDIVGCDNE